MSHRSFPIVALSCLGLACQPAPQPTATGAAAKQAEARGPGQAQVVRQLEPPPVDEVPPAVEERPAPSPAPPWFDPGAYEHAAIVKQDLTGTRVSSGQLSAMIVLELPAGTTPEQCIETARAKLGESIAELPANITTPQGYLQVQGKADSYEYAVVCGVAKDKPTMFLSYTQ